jgi:repressor LexA
MILTFRKRMIVEAIQAYVAEHNYPPTVRELCDMVGLKSGSTMHRHLEDLRKAGMISWEPSRPHTLAVLEREADAV